MKILFNSGSFPSLSFQDKGSGNGYYNIYNWIGDFSSNCSYTLMRAYTFAIRRSKVYEYGGDFNDFQIGKTIPLLLNDKGYRLIMFPEDTTLFKL